MADAVRAALACTLAVPVWLHPVEGALGPEQYCRWFGDAGNAMRLDRWLLRELERAIPSCPVHLRFSLESLLDPDFRHDLAILCARFPDRFVLDMNGHIERNLPATVSAELAGLPVRYAFAQFGTGSISMSRLTALPYAGLMIDAMLVSGVTDSAEKASLCITSIRLARGLGLSVIAEGTATREQAVTLFRNRCRLFSGPWVSPPVAADHLDALDLSRIRLLPADKYDMLEPAGRDASSLPLDLCLEVDDEGTLIRQPEGFHRLVGFEAAALAGRSLFDLVAPEFRDACRACIRHLRAEGHLGYTPLSLVHADGTAVPVTVTGMAGGIADPSLYLLVEDDAAFGEARRNLHGVQAAYGQLFEDNPLATLLWRQDLEIIDWNREATATFGWTRDEAVGCNLGRLLFAEGHPDDGLHNLRLPASDAPEEVIVANVGKDGRHILCRWSNRVIRDLGGHVRFFASIVKDITEDLQKTDRIRQLSRALEKSGSAVVIADMSGVVLWVNGHFPIQTGYGAEEVLDKDLLSLGGPAMAQTMRDALGAMASENGSWEGEHGFRRPDGGLYWCQSFLVRVESGIDHTPCLLLIMRDITSTKEREEKADTLQRLLKEQDRLATLGTMLAGVMHEAFNNMSSIEPNLAFSLKMLDRLGTDRTPDPTDIADAVRDALEGLVRMKEMLLTLKNVARKEDRPRLETCDMKSELALLLGLMKNEYKYCATVETRFEGDIVHAGYPGLLRQVLMNLVINATHAIKARQREDMGHLTLEVRRMEDGWLRIEVTDDGIGMDEAVRARIFEPFFTTKHSGQGTGLGLPISREFIEKQYGGRIFCESWPGVGTRFVVEVPEITPKAEQEQVWEDVEALR